MSKIEIKGGFSFGFLRAMLFSVCRGGKVDVGNSLAFLLLPLLAAGVGAMDCSRCFSKTHQGIAIGLTFTEPI